jgi:DNA polymerase kappa
LASRVLYILKGAQEITQFVNKLPVRKVSGIGNVSEQLLSKVLNIKTCGDLFEKRGLVLLLFKPATAHFLLRASIGLGDTMLSGKESARKSMSSETTFEDTSDPQTLFSVCDNVCTDLAMTLRNNEEGPLKGRQVTVKIKTHKFEIKTKVATLQLPSCDYEIISSVARKILKQFMDLAVDKPLNLRLIGVRISGFNDPLKKHSTSNQPNIQKYLSHKVSKFDQNLPLAQRISHKKKGNRQPGIQSVLTTKSFSAVHL